MPLNRYGKGFDCEHVCGTYDNTERGVWELYLSDHNPPDGSMAPGVHFLGADPDQALKDMRVPRALSQTKLTLVSTTGNRPRCLAVRLCGGYTSAIAGREVDLADAQPRRTSVSQ